MIRLLRRLAALTMAVAFVVVLAVVSAMLSLLWTMNRPVDLDESLSDLFDWGGEDTDVW